MPPRTPAVVEYVGKVKQIRPGRQVENNKLNQHVVHVRPTSLTNLCGLHLTGLFEFGGNANAGVSGEF